MTTMRKRLDFAVKRHGIVTEFEHVSAAVKYASTVGGTLLVWKKGVWRPLL